MTTSTAVEMISAKTERILDQEGLTTNSWYAWNDLEPPPPFKFHVTGQVQVANPGVLVLFYPRVPQGFNSTILVMDLVLIQRPGNWPQVVTTVPVSYSKRMMQKEYSTVDIHFQGNSIASVPVIDAL